jgi:hypothetical protein
MRDVAVHDTPPTVSITKNQQSTANMTVGTVKKFIAAIASGKASQRVAG